MYKSKIKHPYRTYAKRRICQGDILKGVSVTIGSKSGPSAIQLEPDYAIVLTQDCDLEQDFKQRVSPNPSNHDKYIDTILLCPAYPLDRFLGGSHIDGRIMQEYPGQRNMDKIKSNDEKKRYHYIEEDLEMGVPELVIDFKHFFTAPRELVYKERRRVYITTINELYREDISHRFTAYLSRIGLPQDTSD